MHQIEQLSVRLQRDKDGKVNIIEFYSKLFTKTERGWHASAKEAYAIVLSLEHWRKYILPFKTIIYSDHMNHKYLFDNSKIKDSNHSSSKLWRWAARTQDFDFEVRHVSGSNNGLADFISRPHEDNIMHIIDEFPFITIHIQA